MFSLGQKAFSGQLQIQFHSANSHHTPSATEKKFLTPQDS